MFKDHLSKYFYRLLVVLLYLPALLPLTAFGQTPSSAPPVTASNVLANVAAQVPYLMAMVTGISYVAGLYFMIFGILKFKQYGESRTMMSHDRSMMSALVYLFVGVFLAYIPSTVRSLLYTFWTDPNPYGYLQDQGGYSQYITDAFLVIQLFGTIALIRGLILLSGLGSQGHHETLSKGLTHVIGGIFCINIYQFVQLIFATLGIQGFPI